MDKYAQIFWLINLKSQLGQPVELNFLEHLPFRGNRDRRLASTVVLEDIA